MDNRVVLLGYYGGDERHCISAWQSTNIDLNLQLAEDIKERINQLYEATVINKKKSALELLQFLAQHNHCTPFEKSCLDFQITGDIASHIHSIKHRIATSINSESARYKELTDKWYLPNDWNTDTILLNTTTYPRCFEYLTHLHKTINHDWENNSITWKELLNQYTLLGHELYHLAVDQLSTKLGRKRAKESARYFLTYNKQLDYDCMFNFRSFINFQQLRNSKYAQLEIQKIAQQMLELVKAIPENPFKYSLEAFNL